MSQCEFQLKRPPGRIEPKWMSQCGHHAVKGTKLCWQHTPGYKPHGYKTPLKRCQEENERLEAVLRRIDVWAKAYPLEVFPEPDLKRAAKVLKAAGMTLDSITGDSMRHVLDSIKEMVSEVLKEK